MLLYSHVIAACVLSLYLLSVGDCSSDTHNRSLVESPQSDDISSPPLDVSEYTVHFTSYHAIWNNREEWKWQSMQQPNQSLHETIACSKQTPSLCVHAEFSTDGQQHHRMNALQRLKISLRDSSSLRQLDHDLDFWNDLDWSQVTILHSAAHHNNPRRRSLRGGFLYYDDDDDDYKDYGDDNVVDDYRDLNYDDYGDYDYDYDYDYAYDSEAESDDDDDDDDNIAAAKAEFAGDFMIDDEYYEAADYDAELGSIDTMAAMNALIFDVDDDVRDIYNMDDYYKYYDRMSAEEWGVFKKVWKGVKKGVTRVARHIGGKLGIYPRPPCSSSSRCRVHLYFKKGFHKRANKKGHFCEGKWDRWRLHKYRVYRNRVQSINVQGSPCCVAMVYNGNKFDGDKQAMFPRGQYRSMHRGLATAMGGMDGMNGMGGGGMMGMMGGGMGMGMRTHMKGFPNKRMASMRVVHDCKLRQNLMQRGMMRGGMRGGMYGGMHGGGMMGGMMQMMQMMMMMKMMFPKHGHGHKHGMCHSYSCIVHTQQTQLQQLMQMMMMSSMTNQAPITITDNTKKHRRRQRRRRRLQQDEDDAVLAVQKCKLLYDAEVCVTFDAQRNLLMTEYRVAEKVELRPQRHANVSDAVSRIQAMVEVFTDVMEDDDYDDDDDEDEFDDDDDEEEEDLLLWSDIDGDDEDDVSMNVFADLMDIDPQVTRFANRYYDDEHMHEMVGAAKEDASKDDEDMRLQLKDFETQHAMHLFLGPMTYGLNRNEWLFPESESASENEPFAEDAVDELVQSYVSVPADNDVIDYFEQFRLQWSDDRDWTTKQESNGIRCNDRVLSHLGYAVCVDKNAVFFDRLLTATGTQEKSENVSGYADFYQRTNDIIATELDDTDLNVLKDAHWTEIYHIRAYNDDDEQNRAGVRKVCTYVSMLRVCVESKANQSPDDFTLFIEYSSDKKSKHAIRENNAIFNEWLKWSDLD